MKATLCLLSFFVFNLSFAQDIVITGVIDATLVGGEPKMIELFVLDDITVDAGNPYFVNVYSNGGATVNQDYDLAGTYTAGERLLLHIDTGNGASGQTSLDNFFTGCSETSLTYPTDFTILNRIGSGFNGDDAIALENTPDGSGLIYDVYGVIGTDGTGEVWEYIDGWAYRIDSFTPNPTFTPAEWTFSGINVLDGATDNCTASPNSYPLGDFILPLNFLSISATNQGEQGVSIEWRTTSEDNLSHFEIQRMNAGAEFQTLGEKEAIGDFFSVNTYSFIDGLPQEGINQYRAMAVDNEGAKTYSDIVAVQVNSSEERVMYVANTKQILVLGCENQELSIFDIMGQLIYTDEQISNNEAINASGWKNGVFIVRVGNQTHKIAKF